MKAIINKEAFFENKIMQTHNDRLFNDYQEHGEQAIETLREEDPEMWLRIVHEVTPIDVLAHMKALDPNLTEI